MLLTLTLYFRKLFWRWLVRWCIYDSSAVRLQLNGCQRSDSSGRQTIHPSKRIWSQGLEAAASHRHVSSHTCLVEQVRGFELWSCFCSQECVDQTQGGLHALDHKADCSFLKEYGSSRRSRLHAVHRGRMERARERTKALVDILQGSSRLYLQSLNFCWHLQVWNIPRICWEARNYGLIARATTVR